MKSSLVEGKKTDGIDDGIEGQFEQALGTLVFAIPPADRDFSYSIDTISQPEFNTIEIEFLVDYSFKVFDTKWSKVGKPVTVEFPVWGITHPSYSPGVIDDSWGEDVTPCVNDCLLSNLMLISCGGSINNIIPPYESC